MKKQTILLLITGLTTLFFFSCKPKTIKTVEKDYTNKYYLSTDTSKGSLAIDIQVEIPNKFHEQTILDSIRKSIISNLFGESYVSFTNDSVVPAFIADLVTDYKNNNAPLLDQIDSTSTYSFNNEHTLSGFSLYNDKKIYVYGIERFVYMGGAHGLETRYYFNYNLKTGKLITESDLFINNYKTKLSDLIKQRIVEQSKEDSEEAPIMDLENTDYWTDSIKPNGNFYITDEGINYVFNPYEIAPYSLGETEVSLPYDRLKDILKPDNLIEYLVKHQPKE